MDILLCSRLVVHSLTVETELFSHKVLSSVNDLSVHVSLLTLLAFASNLFSYTFNPMITKDMKYTTVFILTDIISICVHP